MQLYAGDIVGVTGWDPFAFALRWRQAGPGEAFRDRVATHIAIIIDGKGPRQIQAICDKSPRQIQAIWPRCRIAGVGKVHGKVVFVWRPRVPLINNLQVLAAKLDGTPYDLPALGAEWGFGRQDSKRYYCSEAGAVLLAAGGCQIPGEWTIKVEPFNMQLHGEAEQEITYRSYRPWW
jgi:hypothetical protein